MQRRIAQRNNLLTIGAAIAISWLFLAISNPYEKLMRERDLSKLGDKIVELENQQNTNNQKIIEQNREIQDQSKQIADLRSAPKAATSKSSENGK